MKTEESGAEDPGKKLPEMDSEYAGDLGQVAELKKINDQIQFITDISPAYMAYVSVDDLIYKYVNRQFEIAFNRPRSEIIGQPIKNIIGQSNYEFALPFIEKVRQGEAASYENEFNLTHGKRWIRVNYEPDIDASGRVKGLVVLSYDVTEQKRVEEALVLIQKRLKEAQHVAKIGWWEYDIKNREIIWSDDMYAMFGVSQEDGPPEMEQVFKLIRSGSFKDGNEIYEDLLNHGTSEFEFSVKGDHGRDVWIWSRGKLKMDSDGKPTRIFGISQDITEWKNFEAAKRESEERLTFVLDGSQLGYWDWNMETGDVFRNERWAEMLGYTQEEIKTTVTQWSDLQHPDDREGAWKSIQDHLDGKTPEHKCVYRMRTKEGDYIWILDQAKIVSRDATGKPLRMCGTHTDLTDQKQLEEVLRIKEEKFRKALDASPFPTAVVDIDHKHIFYWNRCATELFGYSPDTIEEWYYSVFPDEKYRKDATEQWEKMIGFARQTGRPNILGEFKLSCSNGKLRTCQAFSSFLDDVLIITFNDLTHQKEMETEKQHLEFQLNQSQKMEAIGTLAGGIAHDFNNMLSVITGNISYAKSFIDKESELAVVLSNVHKGADRAQQLTQQLLTFAKGGKPIKKPSNINSLLIETANLITSGTKSRTQFNLKTDLWVADVDPGQLSQVFSNIILNADQAMPEGGTISFNTTNVCLPDESKMLFLSGNFIRISISDEGTGIPDKDLKNIFNPYFTTKKKGSGLGLATAYSIIKSHGGHIEAETQYRKGTTFHIYIPSTQKPVRAASSKIKNLHKGKGRILVMDDQEDILLILQRMLQVMGYETHLASDGQQAIDLFEKGLKDNEKYDLLILDLTVPGGMGGAKALESILLLDPGAKAVVSSGYSNDPIMAKYKDYGFCGVIPKPYTMEQLADLLNKVMS